MYGFSKREEIYNLHGDTFRNWKTENQPDAIEHNTVTCMAEIIRTASLLCTCQFTQQSQDLTGHFFVRSYFFMSAKTGKSDRRV